MSRWIFLGLLFAAFLYVTSPFIFPVLIGGIVTLLFLPWYQELLNKKMPNAVAAGVMTFGITVLLLLPISFFIFTAARTVLRQLGQVLTLKADGPDPIEGSFIEKLFNSPNVEKILNQISVWVPVDPDEVLSAAQELITNIGFTAADGIRTFFAHLPSVFVGFAVVVVTVFFLFLDGDRLVNFLRKNSILTPRQTNHLFEQTALMCRSVVLASVVSATVQALVFWIALLSTDVGNVALITILVFLFSFIPLVGSVPVTFSVGIYQLLIGEVTSGIVLLVFGLLVTVLDNFIRPVVIKGAADMHPLIAFISAFGGLQVFGLPGVFLGPIVAGVFLTCLDILLGSRPRRA